MTFYYYIINKIIDNKMLSFLISILVVSTLKNQIVARAQLISFPLFLLEFYSIEELLKTNKKRYYIYLLVIPFLLVSFHSSVYPFYFLMFVPYIIEFILAKMNFKKDENSKIIIEKNRISRFIMFFIFGIIAIFATPNGTQPISYIFKNLGGISSEFILELKSLYISEALYEIILFSIVIAIIAFTRTKVKITDCFFIIGFFILSFSVARSMFFYRIISVICIIRIIKDCLKEYNIKLKIENRKIKVINYATISILIISFMIYNFSLNYTKEYVNEKRYPVKASEYILNNIDIANMKIYNHFNFGSYLEYKGIKSFIDSRSEMYTEEFNKDCTILEDWHYTDIGKKDYKETFEKYDITHALLYKNEIISLYIDDDFEWKKIYEDDNFFLYERVK